jgi:hypothetical protein
MAGNRESDLIAYILGILVIAISAMAVVVASTNTAASSSGSTPNGETVTIPAAVTSATTQALGKD